jgi:ABC-2 type transport system permease protein
MNKLRILCLDGFLAYRGLFPWLTKRLFFPTMVLQPLMQIAAFTIIGTSLAKGPASYYAIGNAVYVGARVALFSAATVVTAERANKTLAPTLCAPQRPAVILGGRLLPPALVGAITSVVMTSAAMFITGDRVPVSAVPMFLALLVLSSLACSAFGLMLGSICIYLRDGVFLPNLAIYAMMAFCGVDFAASGLPTGLRALSNILPLTYGLEGIREVFARQAGALPDCLAELIVALCSTAIACGLINLLERRSRLNGTLDLAI